MGKLAPTWDNTIDVSIETLSINRSPLCLPKELATKPCQVVDAGLARCGPDQKDRAALDRFAVGTEQVPDRLDHVSKSCGIEHAAWAALQIEPRQFDRENVFALCYAVSRKTVLTGEKRHTVGQQAPLLKPRRRTDDDNGIPACDTMITGCGPASSKSAV